MKHFYIILVFVCLSFINANAQNDTLEDSGFNKKVGKAQTDSIVLDGFSTSYYYSKNVLERNYDFELHNKQRNLRMWSNEIRVLGYATTMVSMGFGSWLAIARDWSLWLAIPVEAIVVTGVGLVFDIWAKRIWRKADAIQELSVSIIEINPRPDLCIKDYSLKGNSNLGLGIGFQYKF